MVCVDGGRASRRLRSTSDEGRGLRGSTGFGGGVTVPGIGEQEPVSDKEVRDDEGEGIGVCTEDALKALKMDVADNQ